MIQYPIMLAEFYANGIKLMFMYPIFYIKSPGHSLASTLQSFDVSSTWSCQTTRIYELKAAVMKFNLIFRPRFIKFARTFNISSSVKAAEGCRIRLSLSKYSPSFSKFCPLKLKSAGGEKAQIPIAALLSSSLHEDYNKKNRATTKTQKIRLRIIPQMWKHYNDIFTNKQKSLSLISPFTLPEKWRKEKSFLPSQQRKLFSFVNWKCDNNDILLLE